MLEYPTTNLKSHTGIDAMLRIMNEMNFTGSYGCAAILGIVGGESSWIPQREAYRYSKARLQAIFSVMKDNDTLAAKYARWQGTREEFFRAIYGPTLNPMTARQLGNLTDADGGTYYGRGLIQLTGRANYARYAELTGLDLLGDPEILVRDLDASAKVTLVYFMDRVKLEPDNPGYWAKALSAVGANSPDVRAKKERYYQFFLSRNV